MDSIPYNLDQYIYLLPMIVGIIVIAHNIYLKSKERQAEAWNETEGIITKSQLGISKSAGDTKYEYIYRADIEYAFEVNGERINSDQAFFGDKIYKSGKSKYQKLLNEFPINKPVIVYYNPMDSKESVIIKSFGNQRILNIFIGFGLIIIGVIIESYSLEIIKYLEQL